MFRISFFVDHKNLGQAFKRLVGIARDIEHAYVPNVEAKPNGKVHTSSATVRKRSFRKCASASSPRSNARECARHRHVARPLGGQLLVYASGPDQVRCAEKNRHARKSTATS